jgi:2-oxoacid:acceptor oxidoreductase delta subunit (pyruvate/2-ketoisovalerate family)
MYASEVKKLKIGEGMTSKAKLFTEFYVTNIVGAVPVSHWRVFKPEVDPLKCKSCWTCIDLCPEGCISKGEEKPLIDLRFCKGCGICANECRFSAIDMVEEG